MRQCKLATRRQWRPLVFPPNKKNINKKKPKLGFKNIVNIEMEASQLVMLLNVTFSATAGVSPWNGSKAIVSSWACHCGFYVNTLHTNITPSFWMCELISESAWTDSKTWALQKNKKEKRISWMEAGSWLQEAYWNEEKIQGNIHFPVKEKKIVIFFTALSNRIRKRFGRLAVERWIQSRNFRVVPWFSVQKQELEDLFFFLGFLLCLALFVIPFQRH